GATSALRAVTFQAMARNNAPASANALQPAMARSRGERLGGCRRGGKACYFGSAGLRASRSAFFAVRFALRLALRASPLALPSARSALASALSAVDCASAGNTKAPRTTASATAIRRFTLFLYGAGWRM